MSAAPRAWAAWVSLAAAAMAASLFVMAPAGTPGAVSQSVQVRLSGAGTSDAVLAVATPARSPSPVPLHARRSGGAVIVYVLVLLVFVGMYVFLRDRLRRT
jgi:hypothetical protein